MRNDSFTLYHASGSRSGRTKMMLDRLELGYDTKVIDIRKDENKSDAYLGIHPLGLVPTLIHNEQVIFESAAQVMYLADLFPERDLCPPLGSELRATYLELFVLCASTMEPMAIQAWRSPEAPNAKETLHTVLRIFRGQAQRSLLYRAPL